MTRFLVTSLSLLLLASAALAHGGDDHAHEDAPPVAAQHQPQVELSGDGLELVGNVSDRKLTIYLDRQATNEPVAGATIELKADGIAAGTATGIGNGIYSIPAPWAD